MKLDPRIKSVSDILTCFGIERAQEFIGRKGYFADSLYCFDDLGSCYHGTLTDACDGQAGPFHWREGNSYKQLFLPESSLKPEGKKPDEKKYRPYTLMEFEDKFHIGLPIQFRKKGEKEDGWFTVLQGYWRHRGTLYIFIGPCQYTLDELFNEYEWQKHYAEDFQPFGVEVEE